MLILVLTPFLGRFFCGWICPLGTLFHIASRWLRPKKVSDRIRQNFHSPAQVYKYLILMVLLIASAFGCMQIGLFDPIALLTRTAQALELAHEQLLEKVVIPEPLAPGIERDREEVALAQLLQEIGGCEPRLIVGVRRFKDRVEYLRAEAIEDG